MSNHFDHHNDPDDHDQYDDRSDQYDEEYYSGGYDNVYHPPPNVYPSPGVESLYSLPPGAYPVRSYDHPPEEHYPPFYPPFGPPAGQYGTVADMASAPYEPYENDYDLGRTPSSRTMQPLPSADSPMLVSPERASDYAKMSMSSATPPPSNASVRTYFHRVVSLIRKIHDMPWVSPDRPTVDFYPDRGKGKGKSKGRGLYDRDSVHVTALSWKSQEYIAWRQSHYGHIAASASASERGSTAFSSYTGSVVGSPAPEMAVIEPFPYTSSTHG